MVACHWVILTATYVLVGHTCSVPDRLNISYGSFRTFGPEWQT